MSDWGQSGAGGPGVGNKAKSTADPDIRGSDLMRWNFSEKAASEALGLESALSVSDISKWKFCNSIPLF